jgi:uncharacterized protein (TIGR02246 family)
LLVLSAAGAAACQPATPTVDKAAEAEAVQQVSANWLQAAKDRDVDAVMALVAPDAVFFSAGEEPAQGADAIRSGIEEEWSTTPDFSLDWETTSVQVSDAGDMAWERGTWTYDPDGMGEAQPMHGAYLTVYKRIDGAWKVVSDMSVPTDEASLQEGAAMQEGTAMQDSAAKESME